MTPWWSHGEQPRPWREDSRLQSFFANGFPDDVMVAFPLPASAPARFEMMWVTVIAYDSLTDLFLGVLLNQPDLLDGLRQWDNIVFRPPGDSGYPTAVSVGDEYSAAGWPDTVVPDYLSILRDGIRAYRDGRNGHNMPGIERCIDVLEPLMSRVPDGARSDEVFVGHFVLGRCYAEKYVTEDAIRQFRAAIAVDPDDVDAHMALLAELSVITQEPAGTELSRRRREFVSEAALVSKRFRDDRAVDLTLRAILGDLTGCPEIEGLLECDSAGGPEPPWDPFRWKRR